MGEIIGTGAARTQDLYAEKTFGDSILGLFFELARNLGEVDRDFEAVLFDMYVGGPP